MTNDPIRLTFGLVLSICDGDLVSRMHLLKGLI